MTQGVKGKKSISVRGKWKRWDNVLSIGEKDWLDIRDEKLLKFLGEKPIDVRITFTKESL